MSSNKALITSSSNFLTNLQERFSLWRVTKVLMLLILSLAAWEAAGGLAATIVLVVLAANELYREYHGYRTEQQLRTISQQIKSTSKEMDREKYVALLSGRQQWWPPLLNAPWILIVFIGYCTVSLGYRTEVSLDGIADSVPAAMDFFRGFAMPNWSLLGAAISVYARQTIDIALLGTACGFLLAIPLSLLCSQNLMDRNALCTSVYFLCRLLMVILRSLPTFLLGLIFVALVGLGPFPGVLAVMFFSLGVMVKLFSETIESADMGPLEAVRTCGGSWLSVARFAVTPQVTPIILAQLLYCVEINIHSATVLGLIGAEGIGLPINEYLSSLAYDSAAVFIYVVIAMTIIIDYVSAFLRKRIL